MGGSDVLASVVIPAHNEAKVIGRLLTALTSGSHPGELEIVVVCNGCTDDTAEVAQSVAPGALVESVSEASKRAALARGDELATSFPRFYVDADVTLDIVAIRLMARELSRPEVFAAAPTRILSMEASSPLVRAYHYVWERLPAVATGLYGRGVIAVSREGFDQLGSPPDVLGDDLYAHHVFSPDQRRIVRGATVVVTAPRTMRALLARRTRAAMGNAELSTSFGAASDTTRSSVRHVMTEAFRDPGLALRLPVFLAVTLVARRRAGRRLRHGGAPEWLRDETSRS